MEEDSRIHTVRFENLDPINTNRFRRGRSSGSRLPVRFVEVTKEEREDLSTVRGGT